jgi:phosphoribosylanthranilate isomerase
MMKDRMTERLPIKVCGMRDAENIRSVATLASEGLPVAYMGFIFYEHSPRYAGEALQHPESCALLHSLRRAPFHIKTVGVFVNASVPDILHCVENLHLAAVQLHGNESPAFCAALRKQIKQQTNQANIELIKAISVATEQDVNAVTDYADVVDFVLFDTKPIHTDQYGGTGTQFDWRVLKNYTLTMPFFLSGGISAQSTDDIKRLEHPQLYAIDINSRFELSAGIKNPQTIRYFLQALA